MGQNKSWDNSRFKKVVRISIPSLNFLRDNRGNKSMAKFLEDIISYYSVIHKKQNEQQRKT